MERMEPSFLFEMPTILEDVTDGARVAIQVSSLATRLVQVERTRCGHVDGRAENDAEHALMLSKVAPELARLLYPNLDENLVARFASLHDDLEAYVGDMPTDLIADCDDSKKEELEKVALGQLIRDFGHIPSYCQRVIEYEQGTLPEARFVRAVDKLMVILIHFPNNGVFLKANYDYQSYLESEATLLERYGYKYGEFTAIFDLRMELGKLAADRFLSTD